MTKILHVVDPGTPRDALEMVGILAAKGAGEHRVVAMGHRGVGERAQMAGVGAEKIGYVRSLGWADPVGWRGVKKEIKKFEATHVHAWGICGVVAMAVQSGFGGKKLATFAVLPTEREMKLLRLAEGRGRGEAIVWVGSSSSVVRGMMSRGLKDVVRIRPGVAVGGVVGGAGPLETRKKLGVLPEEGPVVLLGGENERGARQDHGMWAVAVLQQLYPRARAILRVGAGGDGIGEWFATTLAVGADGGTIIAEAPAEMSWGELVRASDILLATPDGPMAVGSILTAMANGTPVIGTATTEVSELVEHGRSGLLGLPGKPRTIAARLEEFMGDSTMRWPLTDRARADVYGHFRVGEMVEEYGRLYGG